MFVKVTKDNQDAMDCFALDRGIRRLVLRCSHPDLNLIAANAYSNIPILWKNLTDIGLASRETTIKLEKAISENHKRIKDFYYYQTTVECLEEMLYEYEYITKKEHSHSPMLAVLQDTIEDDLTFSTEDVDVSAHVERWFMISNYLASQSRRRYSTIVREWGRVPDSLPFLKDPAYNTAAVRFDYGI